MIRPATPADAPQIARVHVRAWQESYPGVMPEAYLRNLSETVDERVEKWQRRLDDPKPDDGVLVAESEGAVVGYCSCGAERKGDAEFQGEVYQLYLLRPHQGKGLGKALLVAAAEHLRARGFPNMLLWTFERSSSRGFYERMGGSLVRQNLDEIAGVRIPELGFGWRSLEHIGAVLS